MSEELFWTRTRATAERLVSEFDGVAGIALQDLTGGQLVEVNAGALFPTASTIKIHLLAALHELHHEGAIDLAERRALPKGTPGSGVLSYLDDEVELSLRDVANLMILVSDNLATNLVIDLIGYERMRQLLDRWGLGETRLQRKMQDQTAVAEGRENLASPRDVVRMLRLLHEGDAFSPGVAEECVRILKKPKKSLFAASLPASVPLANKPGAMDRVRCDAGLVLLESRPFALAIMTKYGPVDPHAQAEWVSVAARTLYDAMAVLDVTSVHGQGVARVAKASEGR